MGVAAPVLGAISFCHFVNDLSQSLISAVYPILKATFHLDFGQLGLITLVFQITASVLQPGIGLWTDKKPMPYSLPFGMGITLLGLVVLSVAPSYVLLLLAAGLVGLGSAIFHPESSRVARLASGGQHGLAQSVFQLGGQAGTAAGPLLAALVVLPGGQRSLAWFSVTALLGVLVLAWVGGWYRAHLVARPGSAGVTAEAGRGVWVPLVILLALVGSKYFYLASIGNYYTFYLIDKFHLSVRDAQFHLFLFLGSVAAGTILGGPLGDRVGRRLVIWWSILGVLPFSLLLPWADLAWTRVLSVVIGLILASAFSSIVVYAQEFLPGRVGLISGLFFGFAFGMAGIGAAALGFLADHTSVAFVYKVCAFLPAIGILAIFLPKLEH